MNDAVNLFLAMAFGDCWCLFVQMIIRDIGGMPRMPRRGDKDEKSKLEIAENTISEGPVELQRSYLESLSFWQHSSDFIEQELKKTKEAIEKSREVQRCRK